MLSILMLLLLFIFGLAAFRQGEFRITKRRKVDSETSRMLGVIMLVGAGLSLLVGNWIGLISLLVAIVIGLMTSKPTVV